MVDLKLRYVVREIGFRKRNVFTTKVQWASLFRMLTILELAIFGAKIQTHVN